MFRQESLKLKLKIRPYGRIERKYVPHGCGRSASARARLTKPEEPSAWPPSF